MRSSRLSSCGGAALLGLWCAAQLLSGCGGSSAGSPAPVQPVISVVVGGSPAVRLGSTAQFTATVSGSANTAVTWEVSGVAGGSSALGTITSTGLYTAPSAIPSGGTVTIAALSVASASASGSLTESLENPLPSISSATATPVGTSLTYALDVHGSGFVPSSTVQAAGAGQPTTFVSPTELTATVAVPNGATSLPVDVANPDPGASTSAILTAAIAQPVASTSAAAAARLLDQSSFGPTAATIQHVQQVGLQSYLTEQFATSTSTLAAIATSPLPAVCLANNSAYPCAESEWWTAAITGPDQLRQRVAFALSEMFVVSTQEIPGQAIPQFHNALANDAFGNFRKVMQDVTLSPAMGLYLNMLNSDKPAAGQIPNENYPRENMQLFTIGINLLNADGTPQLDANGGFTPAYTEAQVQAFARAYTGWTFAAAGGGSPTSFPNKTSNYNAPMTSVESAHDTTAKTLLNSTVLPAGQSALQDLNGALDNLFDHPNTGPFVCRQLIQHLVTSNPSPAYVGRVAAVFANNGNGVRGDMQAVLRAILLDTEARAGDTNPDFDGGHLREPILFVAAMMRVLNATNTDPNGSFESLSNYTNALSERPYRANSVFNFFPPNYVLPDAQINAPEFDIENTATAILRLTLADSIVNNKISGFAIDLSSTSLLGTMAANPGSLVSYLSGLLMHNQMPAAMQTAIVNTITPLTSNAQRARVAVYLVVTSSQYKVIH